nr:dehydratase [Deinococcota bacterium]
MPSFKDVAELKRAVGSAIGPSRWLEVDQATVDRFAEATGDRQWIHTDPDRAKTGSPYGQTVAHGFLTLSLAPT